VQLLYGAMEGLERRLANNCHQMLSTEWLRHPDWRQAERPINGDLQWVILLRYGIQELYRAIGCQVE
jgi:hypothetical protein